MVLRDNKRFSRAKHMMSPWLSLTDGNVRRRRGVVHQSDSRASLRDLPIAWAKQNGRKDGITEGTGVLHSQTQAGDKNSHLS